MLIFSSGLHESPWKCRVETQSFSVSDLRAEKLSETGYGCGTEDVG